MSGLTEEKDSSPSDSDGPSQIDAHSASRAKNDMASPESRLNEVIKQARIIQGQMDGQRKHMLYKIAYLMSEGLTAAQAVDYLAMENGFGQAEWGKMSGGRARQTVDTNARRGREEL